MAFVTRGNYSCSRVVDQLVPCVSYSMVAPCVVVILTLQVSFGIVYRYYVAKYVCSAYIFLRVFAFLYCYRTQSFNSVPIQYRYVFSYLAYKSVSYVKGPYVTFNILPYICYYVNNRIKNRLDCVSWLCTLKIIVKMLTDKLNGVRDRKNLIKIIIWI